MIVHTTVERPIWDRVRREILPLTGYGAAIVTFGDHGFHVICVETHTKSDTERVKAIIDKAEAAADKERREAIREAKRDHFRALEDQAS